MAVAGRLKRCWQSVISLQIQKPFVYSVRLRDCAVVFNFRSRRHVQRRSGQFRTHSHV